MRFAKPNLDVFVSSTGLLFTGQAFMVDGAARTDFLKILLGLINIVAAITAYVDVRFFKWSVVAAVSCNCVVLFFYLSTSWWLMMAVCYGLFGCRVLRYSSDSVSEDESPVDRLRTPASLLGLLCLVLAPAFLLKIVTFDKVSGLWLHLGMATCFGAICEQLRSDNARIGIRGQINGPIYVRAILAWAPVCMLLFPGILITITLETLLGRAAEYVEFKSFEIHALTEDQMKTMEESFKVRKYHWWWPPDLVQKQIDGWHRTLLRSGKTVHKESGFFLRGAFAFVHTGVRGMQIISIVILIFVVSRSFLHVLFRAWLRQGGQVTFRLAYKAREVAVGTDAGHPGGELQS